MNKIANSIFNRLSDILNSSSDDLKEFGSIEKLEEYTELSQKRGVVRKITLLVEGNPEPIKSSLRKKDHKVLNEDILKDVNELFTSIILSKKPKPVKTKVSKQQVKRPPKAAIRSANGRFISIASLQELLNLKLADKIKDNMGKGNAKSILNYRTGRFAKSAVVKKLTRTRDGAITAFYTYMKYPYKTFEPGFAQGFPPSRDPKLLISKSIRQLATELTINKFKVEAG